MPAIAGMPVVAGLGADSFAAPTVSAAADASMTMGAGKACDGAATTTAAMGAALSCSRASSARSR